MSKSPVQIVGLARLETQFAKSPDIVNKHFMNAVQKALAYTHLESGKITPIDTGRLRSSTKTKANVTSGGVLGIIYNNAPYATFVHDGTSRWPLDKSPKNPNTVRQFFKTVVDNQEPYNAFWKAAADAVINELAS